MTERNGWMTGNTDTRGDWQRRQSGGLGRPAFCTAFFFSQPWKSVLHKRELITEVCIIVSADLETQLTACVLTGGLWGAQL